MIVKIKAISQAEDSVKNCEEVFLPEQGTLSDLLNKIGLSKSSPFVYTINGKICTPTIILNDKDELCIIPIISGG